MRQRFQEVFINRIGWRTGLFFGRKVRLETPTLFGRIGEFNETIAQFQTRNVKLKPLGNPEIVWRDLCERCQWGRPVKQKGWPTNTEIRFYPIDENTEEHILPGVGLGHGDPCGRAHRVKRITVGRTIGIKCCQDIYSREAVKGLRHGKLLKGTDRICRLPLEAQAAI